jgi:hypothetical protein
MRTIFTYRLYEAANIVRQCLSNKQLNADIDDIVMQVLESLVGAVLMQTNGVHDTIVVLTAYNVPFQTVDDVVGRVLYNLDSGVIATYRRQAPRDTSVVTFDVTIQKDLIIYLEPTPQPTLLDQLRAEVQNDLDDGSWYPETIKRFVGVL